MPTLTIEGFGAHEVQEGKRLVLAIEKCGVDIGHRCGGNARCTTCRVHFTAGEPETMTQAEYDKLKDRSLLDEVRLACQLVVAGDMEVTALMRVEEMGWSDPGPDPDPEVKPEAVWLDREALESAG